MDSSVAQKRCGAIGSLPRLGLHAKFIFPDPRKRPLWGTIHGASVFNVLVIDKHDPRKGPFQCAISHIEELWHDESPNDLLVIEVALAAVRAAGFVETDPQAFLVPTWRERPDMVQNALQASAQGRLAAQKSRLKEVPQGTSHHIPSRAPDNRVA